VSISEPDAMVFVHAHPDDECMLTGATLAKAASLEIRTIVVYGSRGDAGETNAELDGETLGDRRVGEAEAACAELGVSRVEWLPYADSGMANTATTKHPDAFSNQPPERLAMELATLLADERIIAVVGYDANGTYGHPDHLQVHHVAHAAASALGAAWVLDATYNREYIAGLPDSDGSLDLTFAAAEADLTHYVTGDEWLRAKLSALSNHLSQIPADWDRKKPDMDGFRNRFGTEWYIATPRNGITDLGILHQLLEPK
jgi:LmbE family N-acetylglucosaminyl deacetylase